MEQTNIPVILAGGAGTRLWPLSRKTVPKQFLTLLDDDHSLLQTTLARAKALVPHAVSPIVVCHENHRFLVEAHCRELGIEPLGIILEPAPRNSAAAILLATSFAKSLFANSTLWIMPSDHTLDINADSINAFYAANAAIKASESIVTFGIQPTYPATGYGYIGVKTPMEDTIHSFAVTSFKEKPSHDLAASYVASSNYYWNSGMFVMTADTCVQAFKHHAPDIFESVQAAMAQKTIDGCFIRPSVTEFEKSPDISIDYAIMEKAENVRLVPLSANWNDIGSWDALARVQEADTQGNVVSGEVIAQETKNCLLHATHRTIAASHVENIVVVESADAVLVIDKAHAQCVKDIVSELRQQHSPLADEHTKVYRPWGTFTTLIDQPGYKVKRITVNPGESLSLQRHQFRAEHWVVVEGTAVVRNGESMLNLNANESTYIPAKTLHQLTNNTANILVIIEVQTGTYLGEDDIERFSDKYGRLDSLVSTPAEDKIT